MSNFDESSYLFNDFQNYESLLSPSPLGNVQQAQGAPLQRLFPADTAMVDIKQEGPPPPAAGPSPGASRQYRVLEYEEQLYLDHALVVATYTVWKMVVEEELGMHADNVFVALQSDYEPFNEPHTVTIPVNPCNSMAEFDTLSKARRIIHDIPTWKAYRLAPEEDHDRGVQKRMYLIVLSKPQKWGSQMMPVMIIFRGSYGDQSISWEQRSTPAILLTNSASKWYEKAFMTLALVKMGYNPKQIGKPDTEVKWEDFLTLVNQHVKGVTGSTRLLSDHVSFLTPLHIDSLMRMVQYDKGKVTVKRIRYFCIESQTGGTVPALKQIESTILRYPQSWATGRLVGVLGSSVVAQYLQGHNHPIGTLILRMQFHSPSEVCVSSVQPDPQHHDRTFVDHLTISQHVAPNDHKLIEYIASSPIHKIMLPMQQACNTPVQQASLGPSKTYRTTNHELQRTNQLLMQAFKEGFQPQMPGAAPSLNLDPMVAEWLQGVFMKDSPAVLEEVMSKFATARVTANTLQLLEPADLREMEIPLAPRKLLAKALEERSSDMAIG